MVKDRGFFSDRFSFDIGYFRGDIYYPKFAWRRREIIFEFQTILIWHRRHEDDSWKWHRAGAIRVLGFGFGFAWKYCYNKRVQAERDLNPRPTDGRGSA